MPMKTLVKHCPFCKKVYEQRGYFTKGREPTDEERWLFGSPMRLCPHCGKLFVDKDMQELAITPPRRQDTAAVSQASLRLVILGVALGAILFVAGLRTFALIALGVAMATLIADLALYPTRMKKLENERRASEKRLENPDYAAALKRAGYDIPERYLTKQASTEPTKEE